MLGLIRLVNLPITSPYGVDKWQGPSIDSGDLETINSFTLQFNPQYFSSLDQSATQQLHFASALTFIEATDHRTVSANPASNETHGCQPSNWPARVLSAS